MSAWTYDAADLAATEALGRRLAGLLFPVFATARENARQGGCTSNVTFMVSATDNCAVTNVMSSPASGFAFPVGVTTVTNTARDSSGNSSTCTFTVTVLDSFRGVRPASVRG